MGGRESDMKESGRKKEKVLQVIDEDSPFKKKNKNQRGRVFSKLLSVRVVVNELQWNRSCFLSSLFKNLRFGVDFWLS